MKRKMIAFALTALMTVSLIGGCGNNEDSESLEMSETIADMTTEQSITVIQNKAAPGRMSRKSTT